MRIELILLNIYKLVLLDNVYQYNLHGVINYVLSVYSFVPQKGPLEEDISGD
jgi:hypothetical protein